MMSEQAQTPAPSWHLTHHAKRRAAERGIPDVELFRALNNPDVTYDQNDYGPNRQVRRRGRIGVVVDRSTGAVITAVFCSQAEWLDQLAASVA
ncbi:hypothetical protein BMF89_07520 [Arthrobacter sp. SRS-W-1-2016]|nr:DUF4258 domain-containing protein [Arthrobacter sp. SRS-W-1-2016]OOP63128.1 hypothetical protein BMF89_07520 [Arthrobacter sp. SRS-W-1-2016]